MRGVYNEKNNNKYKYVFIRTSCLYKLYNVRFAFMVYSRGCNLMNKETKKAIDRLNQIINDYINIFDSNKKEIKEIENSLKILTKKIGGSNA